MVTYEEFVKRANKKHNYKYDYSKVSFKKLDNKVCIICPEHGEFWQQANNHLQGQGCPKCCGKGRTQEDIIQEFKKRMATNTTIVKLIIKELIKRFV